MGRGNHELLDAKLGGEDDHMYLMKSAQQDGNRFVGRGGKARLGCLCDRQGSTSGTFRLLVLEYRLSPGKQRRGPF